MSARAMRLQARRAEAQGAALAARHSRRDAGLHQWQLTLQSARDAAGVSRGELARRYALSTGFAPSRTEGGQFVRRLERFRRESASEPRALEALHVLIACGPDGTPDDEILATYEARTAALADAADEARYRKLVEVGSSLAATTWAAAGDLEFVLLAGRQPLHDALEQRWTLDDLALVYRRAIFKLAHELHRTCPDRAPMETKR
jgi:hypothetical protein